jgi:hypothetical protein
MERAHPNARQGPRRGGGHAVGPPARGAPKARGRAGRALTGSTRKRSCPAWRRRCTSHPGGVGACAHARVLIVWRVGERPSCPRQSGCWTEGRPASCALARGIASQAGCRRRAKEETCSGLGHEKAAAPPSQACLVMEVLVAVVVENAGPRLVLFQGGDERGTGTERVCAVRAAGASGAPSARPAVARALGGAACRPRGWGARPRPATWTKFWMVERCMKSPRGLEMRQLIWAFMWPGSGYAKKCSWGGRWGRLG